MDTRHPDEGTIHAYVERQLPLAEQARVDAHVSSCAECAASVAEARGLIAAASRIVGALDDVPAKVIPARPVRRLPPWLAAAAVMVLAVGVSSVAVQRGLESRRDVSTMAADAAGEPQQAVAAESQASPMAPPVTPERSELSSAPTAATGAAPATRRDAGERRSGTVASAADPVRKAGVREEAVVLPAPAASAPPALPPAAADFSAAEERASASERATGAAAPIGRAATRMQAAAPSDAAALSLRQSEITITGRVMTADGSPLAGANVFVSSLNLSVGTDATGRYTLIVPPGEAQRDRLVVRARAIGYVPQEQLLRVPIGSQTADFELRRDGTQLTEVTITGGTTVAGEQPERTTRYEAAPGVIVELREFHAAARIPPARPGTNEYRWGDASGARQYVLSGPLAIAELERLAGRLGELRIVR
ncbi:MAG TPA: carboxypeptidase regulatory-like domain-containing protein [Gemmatimonadaceae bacterium]